MQQSNSMKKNSQIQKKKIKDKSSKNQYDSDISEEEFAENEDQILREKEFDKEYDTTEKLLEKMQEICKEHGTDLFYSTTTLDLWMFLHARKRKNRYPYI